MVCARRQKVGKDQCVRPCEGIYADIRKEPVKIVDKDTPGMKDLFIAYENYKNQYLEEPIYPKALQGRVDLC